MLPTEHGLGDCINEVTPSRNISSDTPIPMSLLKRLETLQTSGANGLSAVTHVGRCQNSITRFSARSTKQAGTSSTIRVEETMDKEQFDAFLGGSVELPRDVQIVKLAAARASEIAAMTYSIGRLIIAFD